MTALKCKLYKTRKFDIMAVNNIHIWKFYRNFSCNFPACYEYF